MPKLLVIQVAALGAKLLAKAAAGRPMAGLPWQPLTSVFPAVTCTAQASFRTGQPAAEHGMIGNGFYERALRRVYFWEQSSALYAGPRIWDGLRQSGGRVAQLFWQQSLGTDSDIVVSPAPIHKHGGGMIDACYGQPPGRYEALCQSLGRPFKLRWYWGPLTSRKGSAWIAEATASLLKSDSPDLLLTYLPHLDYEQQKSGPASAATRQELDFVIGLLNQLVPAAQAAGYRVLIFGDYAIAEVTRYALPNQALRRAGLFSTRDLKGMLYPDLHRSRAFAVVDHQVAHVYCADAAASDTARGVLRELPGVAAVLTPAEQRAQGLAHARSGELLVLAKPDAWLAYPWWDQPRQAPDFATHVDIHNKPGYDPCELFFGRTPLSVSLDPGKIRGSHGLLNDDTQAVLATDLPLADAPADLAALGAAVGQWLGGSR